MLWNFHSTENMHCSNIKIKKNLNRSDSKDNYFRWLNKRPVPEARYFPPVKRFLIHPDTILFEISISCKEKDDF